jgi:hypothetical protein
MRKACIPILNEELLASLLFNVTVQNMIICCSLPMTRLWPFVWPTH